MSVGGASTTERRERSSNERSGRAAAFLALTKPGITRMIVLSTGAGFYVASAGAVDWVLLFHALLGTGLVSSGASALNQYFERDVDSRMARTRFRPLPAGTVRPREAVVFSALISVAGLVYLGILVNVLTALIVAATLASYDFLYTPLKRRTTFATLVGAIPGALPISAGWTATGRPLEIGAWVLFAILFLWQIPHFLALALLYRDDYRAGGLVMLSVSDADGLQTARQIFNYTAALIPVSLLPSTLGMTGAIYFIGALVLGGGFLYAGFNVLRDRSRVHARQLFLASVLYLPALLLLMMVDTLPG